MSEIRPARILIVDDESPIREVLSASLRDEGHEVYTASDGQSGLAAMDKHHPEIVFLDIWMPGSLDGIEVLTTARKAHPDVHFVMISGHGTIETAVRATKLGAWDFIEKPLSMDKILITIQNIVHYLETLEEKQALLNKLRKSIALVGEAPAMVSLKQMIARVAPQSTAVFLVGENGSGKELTARNIHYMSSRASRPFVDVHSSTLPADLFDYEIFGYEKGAFPGAEKTQKGKLELAQGGTVFIDDIIDLSLGSQEKLLKLLVDKKFQRAGGKEWVELAARVIAASSKDLDLEVAQGRFLPELRDRLEMTTYSVPPLRAHAEDVPALVNHFSEIVAKEGGFTKKEFSAQALEMMGSHIWPGNVRELKNFVERVYILTPGDFVDVHDLRFAGLEGSRDSGDSFTELPTFREARARFEKEYLIKKIAENQGNISRTAEVIGLERSYLHRKIKSFGIEVSKGSDDQL